MSRSPILAALAVTGAAAFAACGSGEPSGPAPATVKSAVEQAAHVKLSAVPIPGDARAEGLVASYSNGADATAGKDAVFLFMVKDAGTADKVAEQARGMVPAGSRLIVDGKVIVLYATTRKDRGADVEQAVEAL